MLKINTQCLGIASQFYLKFKRINLLLFPLKNITKIVLLNSLKGYIRYIFAILLLSLKVSTFEKRKNVSYFTSKAIFVLEILRFDLFTSYYWRKFFYQKITQKKK